MNNTFASWIVKWRWLVLPVTLLIIGYAFTGGRFLSFTSDYKIFFSGDNPQLLAFEKLQDTYTKNDNVLLVIAPKGGQVFTSKTLSAVTELTKRAWQIPYSIRVDSITNFQHTSAEEDDLVVADLVGDTAALNSNDIEKIKHIALNEPLLVHRLISPAAHVTGVNVTVQLPGKNEQTEVLEVATFARQIAEEVRKNNPDLDVYLTGVAMMNAAFPEASQKDMQTLVPIMFVIVIVMLGILLRSISATIATLAVILLSILGAMGLTGWAGIKLSPPSSAAPSIILTMAVADCVHILVNFLQNMRHGLEKREAIIESIRVNLQPIFITSLSTAIGFLSMNFSDSPPFQDLGNIVAMGVMIAFVLSVTFFPALLMVLPIKVRPAKTQGSVAMERFSNFVVQNQRRLLWGMSAITVGLVLFIPNNELNDEFVKYFDESVDFRQATDFTTDNLTGIYQIEYSLHSGEKGGVSEPGFLNKVEEFAQWYRQQPEVMHVNSFTDTLKRLNKNMHGDDPGWYRIPDQRDLAAQYLLLYEMSLPYGLDLNNRINVNKSSTRFSVTLYSLSSNEVLALEARAKQWLKTNAPTSMQVDGSSPTVIFAHIGNSSIRSMLIGTTVALILISVILIFTLCSLKLGIISLVPNLIPAALAFGIWGIFVGQIGMAVSVVIGMTLGIVVDDTVHFLSKYQRALREQGMNPEDAVRYAFSTVGTALFTTSAVLIAGFLVLTLSAFEVNSGMAILTAITITAAIAADFLLLPPLLIKAENKND